MSDFQTIRAPFYQVKAAGVVVDHTMSREGAHSTLHHTGARPAELWRIQADGTGELLERLA